MHHWSSCLRDTQCPRMKLLLQCCTSRRLPHHRRKYSEESDGYGRFHDGTGEAEGSCDGTGDEDLTLAMESRLLEELRHWAAYLALQCRAGLLGSSVTRWRTGSFRGEWRAGSYVKLELLDVVANGTGIFAGSFTNISAQYMVLAQRSIERSLSGLVVQWGRVKLLQGRLRAGPS
jgi:hypothetical protein